MGRWDRFRKRSLDLFDFLFFAHLVVYRIFCSFNDSTQSETPILRSNRSLN